MLKRLFYFFTKDLNSINSKVFILFFLLPYILFAKNTKKIIITGDYIEYDTKNKNVIVKGNATAFNNEMNIRAETIQANIDENRIFCFGNVVLWQNNEKHEGEFVYYDMKNGAGFLKNGRVTQGYQIISAERIDFSMSYLKAENLSMTTDDSPNPDYEINADRMFIKYGDYMEINNMRVIFHGKVINNKKYQYTDLKEKPKIFKQKFGYTKNNGVYANIYYPYTLPMRSGNVGISYRERKSIGLNLSESMKIDNKNSFNYGFSYLNDDLNNQVNKRVNINYTGNGSKAKGNIKLDYSSLKYQKGGTNKELNNSGNLSGKWEMFRKKYQYSLKYNDRTDIDDEEYKGDDYYSSLERIPEVNITLPSQKYKFMSTNLRQTMMIGKYHQTGSSSFRGEKYALKNMINLVPFKGGKLFPFNMKLNEDWFINYYSSSELMQVLNFRLQVDQKFKGFRDTFRYNKKNVLGDNSPFRFDNESETETLSMGFDYSKDRYSAKLFQTTYSFDNKKFNGGYSDLRLISEKNRKNNWSFYLKGNYDIMSTDLMDIPQLNITLNTIYSQFTLKPNDPFRKYSMNVSGTYNAKTSKMRDMNGTIDFRLAPKAHLNINSRYDFSMNDFTAMKYTLNYDLHSFASNLIFDFKSKDMWFEVYLKAAPNKGTKLYYDADKKRIKPIMRHFDI